MQGTGRCASARCLLCQDRQRGGSVRHCRRVQQTVRQAHLPPPPCLWRGRGTVGRRGKPTLGAGKAEGKTIRKIRYEFNNDGYLSSIDVFSGELTGLIYLEVEFLNKDEAKAYQAPDWAIKEVTDDPLYKNGSLAQYGIPSSYYKYVD